MNVPLFPRLGIRQEGNAADCLFGFAGNCQGIHNEIEITRHSQQQRQGVKGQSVRILKHDQPINAVVTPLFRYAVFV